MRYLFSLLFTLIVGHACAQTTSYDPKECVSTQKLISIYSGKGTVMLPGCFERVPKETLEEKYPGSQKKPDLNYGIKDVDYVIAAAFTIMDAPTKQEDIPGVTEAFKKMFTSRGFNILSTSVEKVNGKEYGILEFISIREGSDDVYNIVYFSDLNGKLLLASFDCNIVFRDQWQKIGKEILSSLKIK